MEVAALNLSSATALFTYLIKLWTSMSEEEYKVLLNCVSPVVSSSTDQVILPVCCFKNNIYNNEVAFVMGSFSFTFIEVLSIIVRHVFIFFFNYTLFFSLKWWIISLCGELQYKYLIWRGLLKKCINSFGFLCGSTGMARVCGCRSDTSVENYPSQVI